MSDEEPTTPTSESASESAAASARPVPRPKAKPRYGAGEALPTRAASKPTVRKAKPSTKPRAKPRAKKDPAPKAERSHSVPGWIRRPVTIYTAIVAAAAIFAGYALVAWINAGNDESVHYAKARDAVLLDARQDIVVLNTLDYRKVDAGLKSWLDASTGDLHEQIANVTATDKKDLVNAKKISSGKVIDVAVTELDNRAGSATVIATVETSVSPSNGTPPKRNRFSATLARDGSSWKLSDLQQVAVNLS